MRHCRVSSQDVGSRYPSFRSPPPHNIPRSVLLLSILGGEGLISPFTGKHVFRPLQAYKACRLAYDLFSKRVCLPSTSVDELSLSFYILNLCA